MFAADEALVDRRIQQESHRRINARYDRDAMDLRGRLAEIRMMDNGLAEKITKAVDLFEALPRVWYSKVQNGDARGAWDLVGSIAPEKVVFDGEKVRTPFGSAAKRIFGPESQKIANAEPLGDPASSQACPGRFELPTF